MNIYQSYVYARFCNCFIINRVKNKPSQKNQLKTRKDKNKKKQQQEKCCVNRL